jgi:hypothetical protein
MDGARYKLMRRISACALLASMLASSACSRSDARASEIAPADTLYTGAASLRRFRASLDSVGQLSPEFTSGEAVARAFVAAVAAHDAERVAHTLMTRAEFAWLYYPENPISRPPYELPAGLAWFELEGNSLAGLRRALASYGRRALSFGGLQCTAPPVSHGPNRLWNGCIVTLRLETGSETSVRMFGTILERGGRFKIATAANDL